MLISVSIPHTFFPLITISFGHLIPADSPVWCPIARTTASALTSVSIGAFAGCKKLTGVTIGGNVKSIGAKAFNGCLALKKITVKSTVVKAVGKNALKGTAKKLVIKVPKKKLAEYKKIFKGKGQNKLYKVK